nr:MAG TPA: hypothetical protein [Caudoviricetes sp.]
MSKFHAIYGKGGVSPEPGEDIYGEVHTLLWTNPSPNKNFSAQKVTLDLSKYDGVIIEYAFSIANSNISSRIKLEKNISYAHGGGFLSSTNTANARNVTAIDDTGVTFTDNKDTDTANNNNIPLKIYGYRQYEAGTIEFNWSVSSSTNASETISLKNNYTAPLDGYYKRSNITGFTSANSNLTTEFAYKKAGDVITLIVSKSEGVQNPSNMTIYYSSKGDN